MATDPRQKLKDLASLRIDHDSLEERRAPRRPMRWIFAVVMVAVAGYLSFTVYRRWIEPLGIPEVEVAVAEARTPTERSALLTASGYIVAQRQASVTSKITGRLEELTVREGSWVKKGEIIGRLENRDIRARLEEARRTLEVARAAHGETVAREFEASREFERQQRLLLEEVSSQSEYDAAEARYKVAEAQVRSSAAEIPRAEAAVTVAEVALENTFITAPFDGVVTTKSAEAGEIVAPVSAGGPARGNSIVLIANMESLEAEVDINESNIGRLRVGQPAEIILDAYPDRRYSGILRQIVPTADRQKATIQGKVAFAELSEEILPEMSARVTFLEAGSPEAARPRTRVFVPRNSMVTRGGALSVLVVREGRISVVPIQAGPEVQGSVEILSGLEGGESLVMDPPSGIEGGARVRVRQAG
jgi:RND family efflux transporter MFP subunit